MLLAGVLVGINLFVVEIIKGKWNLLRALICFLGGRIRSLYLGDGFDRFGVGFGAVGLGLVLLYLCLGGGGLFRLG